MVGLRCLTGKGSAISAVVVALLGMWTFGAEAKGITPKQKLGKSIFFDKRISINENQACAACHAPEVGWTGPALRINLTGGAYEGSIHGRFGNRKPPSAAYATQSPILYMPEPGSGDFVGGNFWDGNATGEKLGNPAADQAQGPFRNPLEQALPDSACVVYKVCTSKDYGKLFNKVFGKDSCDIHWDANIKLICANEGSTVPLSPVDRAKADAAFDNVAYAIADYEGSPEVNAFTSKYDYYLAGKAKLTPKELRGLALFNDPNKGNCSACHPSDVGPFSDKPLFTDYTFDNLGVPKNPLNPFYYEPAFNPDGRDWVDQGLGGYLAKRTDEFANYSEQNKGKFKVPSLRNVDKRPFPLFVKDYGHNGYFKSLKRIVHFYNTRDVLPACKTILGFELTDTLAALFGCWPKAEQPLNVNANELGNLGLTEAEEDAIVAFLQTLSDGYRP